MAPHLKRLLVLPLGFTEEPASQALRGQGYGSVAVSTTRLGLNDIILLEY